MTKTKMIMDSGENMQSVSLRNLLYQEEYADKKRWI